MRRASIEQGFAASVAAMVALTASLMLSSDGATAEVGVETPVRGMVRAVNQASISIDIPVRVSKLHVREAEAFRKGDVLVAFDCRRLQAEHAAARAASREMRITFESQTYLNSRGAVGKFDVDISHARADRAEAEAAAIAARLEQCTIHAPFSGRVTELKINEHEVPPSGQPFISLVDETHFELDLILPSNSLRVLEPGTDFPFQVDETGLTYEARLVRLGASVDPVSQSIKAIAAFHAPDQRLVAGMSGTAFIAGRRAPQ